MVGLLEVQEEAIKAASHREGGFAYWMEMGLGKTLTALTEFIQLVDKGEATRLVVVCPNSFKTGWRDEIVKQGINVDPWVYSSGADNEQFLRKRYDKPPVLIVNYEAIRRVPTQDYIFKFISNRKCMVVFDESIQIKTHNSQQTKAAIMLSREFKYTRILSGKPMTQGPHDLWGQLRAIGKLDGMNYYAFRNLFCRMGGYMNKKVTGVQNEQMLAGMVDPHVFRATKDQWTDLPPKIMTTREFAMAPGQLSRYRTMEAEFVAWLKNGDDVSVDMAITKHIKLAQIQFGFIIDEDGKVHELVEPASNPRINAIKEIIEDEVSGKVVVVYHHRYAGEVLLRELAEYSPAIIRGGMEAEEVTNQRNRFNRDEFCRVICIQTTAGKYGHTLIGGEEPKNHCSTMIFAENTWSLDTRSQLEDRIHRIGQRGESCLYVDLVCSPLDRQIVRALQFKQSIFDAVMRHVGINKEPEQ